MREARAIRTSTALCAAMGWLLIFAQGCRAQDLPKDALLRPAAPAYDRTHRPVQTHRFWAAKNWFPLNLTAEGGPYTMFPEPLAVQTTPHGLLVGYASTLNVSQNFFVHPVQHDLTLGVGGLNAREVTVSGSTDRMVDLNFGPIMTRVGRGMPFVYAETTRDEATVTFTSPPVLFVNEPSQLGVTLGPNNYGLFCPAGGRWTGAEKTFTCHMPAGHHYLSVALLPNRLAFTLYARYAFAFPTATPLTWSYDREKSQVLTNFDVVTEIKEGSDPGFLQALYAHQYTSLAGAPASTTDTYASARGPMRVLTAKHFTTVDTFHGLLPFLPLPATDAATERGLLKDIAAEHDHFTGPDTYNQGKRLNRLAQLLPLAKMSSQPAVLDQLATALRAQFAQWSAPGERSTHRFVYDTHWGTLIGYPASFGSNTQLNDHHFHYGYWIDSAALLGLFDRGWLRVPENADFVRDMVNDIASIAPGDDRYPMLRHFDAYAGHSWASGQAPFGDGENQESSSEAINAWAGIVLFATETGDTKLRDAAIWMYTLEANAARDYWFNDGPVSTFPAGFARTQITNLFDGKSDAATWFGNAPEFEHGIQFLPFSGASLYLGGDPAYVRRNLAEVTRANGGAIQTSSDKWPDLMEMYEGFYDPRQALAAWRATPFVFDGESKAHEFAWLSSMSALGRVDQSVTADTPFYAVFRNDAGVRTHVAFNPNDTPLQVRFSDGVSLKVPAHAMVSGDRVYALP